MLSEQLISQLLNLENPKHYKTPKHYLGFSQLSNHPGPGRSEVCADQHAHLTKTEWQRGLAELCSSGS